MESNDALFACNAGYSPMLHDLGEHYSTNDLKSFLLRDVDGLYCKTHSWLNIKTLAWQHSSPATSGYKPHELTLNSYFHRASRRCLLCNGAEHSCMASAPCEILLVEFSHGYLPPLRAGYSSLILFSCFVEV